MMKHMTTLFEDSDLPRFGSIKSHHDHRDCNLFRTRSSSQNKVLAPGNVGKIMFPVPRREGRKQAAKRVGRKGGEKKNDFGIWKIIFSNSSPFLSTFCFPSLCRC